MSVVVPIGQGESRLPQAGRIRLGITDSKARGGRRAIETFRFTSQDPALLVPVAEVHGGEIRPFSNPKSPDTHELISEAKKINVVLPPDPLSRWYELWSGKKGLERRCDGEWCDMRVPGPDGAELDRVECRCARLGVRECDYKLRLSVLLPEVPSLGVWRLDTSSENAWAEIPGVVALIEMAQGRGLYKATLRLDVRTKPGQRFHVPVLDPGLSIEALMAGDARLGQLSAPAYVPPELTAGGDAEGVAGPPQPPPAPATVDADDEIIDAEVLAYDPATGIQPVDPTIGRAFLENLTNRQKTKAIVRAREIALETGDPVPTTLASASTRVVDRLVAEHAQGAFD